MTQRIALYGGSFNPPGSHHRRIAERLAESFDRIDATIDDIRANTADTRLTVFSHATVAVEWLVPRIGSFHRSHPDIDLQLFPMLEPKGLYDGSVDAGVWSGPEDWPDTEETPLFYPEYFPICSPKLLDGNAPNVDCGDSCDCSTAC